MRIISCVLITSAIMAATGICEDSSVPATKSSCEKLPVPCNILCREAESAESHAAALEKATIDARANAVSAENTASFFEEIASRKAYQEEMSDQDVHWYERKVPILQALTGILWSRIVPREVMKDYKISKDSSIRSPVKGVKRKEVAESIKRAQEARDKADAEAKAAFFADSISIAAREAASKARSKYEECLCW